MGMMRGTHTMCWRRSGAGGLLVLLLAPAPYVLSAEPANDSSDSNLQEIVVTAQKREQSINDVPMSITAITGSALLERGISTTADLDKVVPGFTQAETPYDTPIYTLRGVGLYDTGLASSPTVSVYVDQVPLPFPVMAEVATLDLERVEVLKGPQGILFGQNSTGGAINYIAAKPTDTFRAGGDVTYERFNKIDVDAFVSGPLSDTVDARLAVQSVEGGAWQQSRTRPDDMLGDDRELSGRLLLDWKPSDRLKVGFSLTGNMNDSDTQVGQAFKITPNVAGGVTPPLYKQPFTATNDQEADWTPGLPLRHDDYFYQGSIRTDYEIAESMTLTSITSSNHQEIDQNVDFDGTTLPLSAANIFGWITSSSQELRLAGNTDALNWIVGGNYEYDQASETEVFAFDGLSSTHPIPTIPSFDGISGTTRQDIDTAAAFANIEYKLTQALTIHAGSRYTDARHSAEICELATDANFPAVINTLQELFVDAGIKTTPVVPITQKDCTALTPAPDLSPEVNGSHVRLAEDNVSWRVGSDYKMSSGTLLYVNASRGFKSGIISNILGTSTAEYDPAKQERLDAYEAGFKAPLFGRRVQLDAATFYYSYKNKQVQTKEIDPVFGPVLLVANVPKSYIWGVEGALEVRPMKGLTMSVSELYMQTKVISSFVSVNQENVGGNFDGSKLPYAPAVTLIGDVEYGWPISSRVSAFIGGSFEHRGATNTTFQTATLGAPDFTLPTSNVLDLRAGVTSEDGSWRLTLFGRNVTNDYYWNFVYNGADTTYRLTAKPVTYGVTLSLRTP